ncbi:hypothetical protein D3C80_1315400 [compost metagenome]
MTAVWLYNIDTLEYMVVLADDRFGKSANSQDLPEPARQSGSNGKTGEYPDLEKLRRMKPGSKEARRFAQEIVQSTGLVKTERGRNGGTWLHPKLAVVFAN